MNLRTLRAPVPHLFIRLGVVAIVAAGAMSASVVGIYGGIDTGVGPGGPFPNASAAQAQFWIALGVSAPNITFEGVASLGSLGPSVTASILNSAVDSFNVSMSGLQTTDQHTPEPLGFNVTPGGNEWLKITPPFNSTSGASAVFNFSSAINAFGVWITDTQSNFPGQIRVTFNDGTDETLLPTKNEGTTDSSPGGAVFYGFITDSPFTSVTINTGGTNTTRDAWGLDDITFGLAADATPEPSTLSLLGVAALLAISLKFRGKALRSVLPIRSPRR